MLILEKSEHTADNDESIGALKIHIRNVEHRKFLLRFPFTNLHYLIINNFDIHIYFIKSFIITISY